MAHPAGSAPDSGSALEQAAAVALGKLRTGFDPLHGGFSQPPKTPQPRVLDFLLRQYARSGDREALHMACHSLRRMALSGINDQAGGGFFTRAHDTWWMIPDFEKRTGDNARLILLYTDAWHATGDSFFARIARETIDWALKEMRTSDGAFLAAIGATGDTQAARYYSWTPEEAEHQLEPAEYALARCRFGLNDSPNLDGRWHLHVYASLSELAKVLHQPKAELEDLLASTRHKLWAARRRRPGPSRDDSVRASDNALMVCALGRAGRLLEAPELLDYAEYSLAYLNRTLRDGGPTGRPAAADAALLLEAVLELLQARWSTGHLDLARGLAENLQAPLRSAAENVPPPTIPALYELGMLLGEKGLIDNAKALADRALVESGEPGLDLLAACQHVLQKPRLAVLQGPAAQVADWRRQAERYFNPARRVYAVPEHMPLPPALAGEPPAAEGSMRAWVCTADGCQGSVDTLDALLQALRVKPA